MGWTEPKIDWTSEDRLNYQDYNRIKNNLEHIWAEACAMYGNFPLADMGEDISSYEADWKVQNFNAIESNIDVVNEHIFTQDFGIRQTFYENGPFIRYGELNRIEGATLRMKGVIDGAKAGKVRLSFRLGAKKEIKI